MNNTIQANQLLAQMRALQAQAGIDQPQAKQGLNQTQNVDFASILKESVDSVNNQVKTANSLATALERGESNVTLAEVMIEKQKASVGFEAMKRVRNDLISAYKEIMNMPV
jgi:flagellar hook-basal body complex protein FliE